jgi:CheY-like chemotaxis protein
MDTSIFPRRPLRALILDDLHDAADSLATLVRFWGHNPLVAYDGPTALGLARNNRPDVALLETGLRGGMDGCEVARRLRRLPGGDKLLLVAVTGYGREEDIRRCWDAGIDFHFVKPVDPGYPLKPGNAITALCPRCHPAEVRVEPGPPHVHARRPRPGCAACAAGQAGAPASGDRRPAAHPLRGAGVVVPPLSHSCPAQNAATFPAFPRMTVLVPVPGSGLRGVFSPPGRDPDSTGGWRSFG